MTPLHLAALNGNDNILEMIGKNNLNSRDYRSRKADQLLGRLLPPVNRIQPTCKVLRVLIAYDNKSLLIG